MRTKYKVDQRLKLKLGNMCIPMEFHVYAKTNGLLRVTVYDPLIDETYSVWRWEVTPI